MSRQALSAIEAGRQVPSTTLSLQLARALGCGVEDLFALEAPALIHAALVGSAENSGRRVALGRVDGAWTAHAASNPARPGDGLIVGEVADGGDVRVEPLADIAELENNVLVAGCAPLLGLLAGRLGRRYGDARATWLPANSAQALKLLAAGHVHVAGLHLVDTDTVGGHADLVRAQFPGQATTIIGLTRWRQGLVVAAGNPLGIRTIEDIARPDVRFAGREAGSGANNLVLTLLGTTATHAVVAAGHADVARLVRWGVADVGVAIEAAALAEGLDFIALAEERFDLILPTARLELAPVARLLDLIDQRSFRAEAARVPGYDLGTSGHAVNVDAR